MHRSSSVRATPHVRTLRLSNADSSATGNDEPSGARKAALGDLGVLPFDVSRTSRLADFRQASRPRRRPYDVRAGAWVHLGPLSQSCSTRE
jgi:hypothetical protein